jgi:FkbM family methyltransferase
MADFDLNAHFEKIKPNLGMTESKAGPMIVYMNDGIVSHAIMLYGEYCDAEVQIMSRYLDTESVYLDIGTNIGFHAMSVNKTAGCAVLGFEPHPSHFSVAAHNCHNKNIRLYNVAVGATDGEIIIKDFDETEVGNYGDVSKTSEGITVPQVKLDTLELDRCTLMKIDVEGLEFEVLQGATDTLHKFRPVVFFEAIEHEVWNKCVDYLAMRSYSMYWVSCLTKPNAETFKQTDENPFGTGGVSNILAVPNEKMQPTDLAPVTAGEKFEEMVKRLTGYKLIF